MIIFLFSTKEYTILESYTEFIDDIECEVCGLRLPTISILNVLLVSDQL